LRDPLKKARTVWLLQNKAAAAAAAAAIAAAAAAVTTKYNSNINK